MKEVGLEPIQIGDSQIGTHSSPFIIAEISGNHRRSLKRALKIVELAAKAGVDAIKLQTYKADTMTLDVQHAEFMIDDTNSARSDRSLFDLYDEASTLS